MQAAPLVQHSQVLILHLWKGKKHVKEVSAHLHTYHLLLWPVLRLHVLLDAAVAALDARRLRTPATVQHRSTEIQLLMSAAERTRSFSQPWTNRREAHMTIRAMWDR